MVKSKIKQYLYTVQKVVSYGDEYDPIEKWTTEKTHIGTYPSLSMAQKKSKDLEEQFYKSGGAKYGMQNPYGWGIETHYVPVREAWSPRAEFIVDLYEVDPIQDTCGEIRELIATQNMSMAYFKLNGKAKEHKHDIMEEFYFITEGRGHITVADKKYEVEKNESINIPKGEWHYLEGNLEGIVMTHPKFNPEDVILR